MDKTYTSLTSTVDGSKMVYAGQTPLAVFTGTFMTQDVSDAAITATVALRNHDGVRSGHFRVVAQEIEDADGPLPPLASYAVLTALLAPLFGLWNPDNDELDEAWEMMVNGVGGIQGSDDFIRDCRLVAAAVITHESKISNWASVLRT